MNSNATKRFLAAVRLLRAGIRDRAQLDAEYAGSAPSLDNLAGVCRTLTMWVDAEVADRRAGDAFVRFFGLGTMPERRESIAATLRRLDGRRGVSVDLVDKLIAGVTAGLAERIDDLAFPRRWTAATPPRWCDPFPIDELDGLRTPFDQIRLLAWADVPSEATAAAHQTARAMLLYEQEHGLRRSTVTVSHRQERQRLRRLAWAMMWVARQRFHGKQPDDVMIDRLLGPRQVATVEHLDSDLATALATGKVADRDAIDAAVGAVRIAVRHGHLEAPELLGLVRDAIARAPIAVPAASVASVLSLRAILAREHLDVTGVQAGREAIELGAEAIDAASTGDGRRPGTAAVLTPALRSAQELAELCDQLSRPRDAQRFLRSFQQLVRRAADAYDGDPVWEQQYLQSFSSIARHHAAVAARPRRWLDAAERAADRTFEIAGSTPHLDGQLLGAANQRSSVAIARIRLLVDDVDAQSRRHHQLIDSARQRVNAATRLAAATSGDERPLRSARLGAARRRWELALLTGDDDEVDAAREATLQVVGDWALPMHLAKLDRLEAATAQRPRSMRTPVDTTRR